MSKTKIDWADMVWNPVTGCSKVSEGCKNCYAEKMAERLQKMGCKKYANGFKVTCHENELVRTFPGKWKRIFVNSMSDLFHEEVTDDFIDRVICTIALNPQHTFIVLTKRVERMRNYFQGAYKRLLLVLTQHAYPALFKSESGYKHLNKVSELRPDGFLNHWPLKNLWPGASVENKKAADERIPLLLKTPAALRLVSVEPMLGEIDLGEFLPAWDENGYPVNQLTAKNIDWVICGCESGSNRRPFNPDWARSLRDQCVEASIPFFLKQMPFNHVIGISKMPLLDGKIWNQIPEVNHE